MGPIRTCPYGQARIHPILGTYGLAIWATHESIIGVSICACPHWTHMGRIHPILGLNGLAIWAPHGSIMGSPFEIVRIGLIWAVYILYWV